MTCPEWLYYLLAILLCIANLGSACLNLIALPGNWLVLAASFLFALLIRSTDGLALSWHGVGTLFGLALLGEAIEMFAGIVGAARLKASRRGIVLSIAGSIVGSILGATMGLPIPLIGPAIMALLGGAIGAFVGAFVGEDWKGETPGQSWAVGRAAFVGRLFGTFGKFIVGIVMVIWASIDVFRT